MRKRKKDEKCTKDVKKLQEMCFKNWLGFMIVKTQLGGPTWNSFHLLLPPDIPPSLWFLMKLFSTARFNAQIEPHMPGDEYWENLKVTAK